MPTSVDRTENDILDQDIQRLRDVGHQVEVFVDAGQVGVVVVGFRLPAGAYNKERTDLLLRTDAQYPQSAMDMFWVDEDLVLGDGRVPTAADSMEAHFERTWRRYSWHRNAAWIPGRDDLVSHLEFCTARLQRPE